ncbi:MAG: class I SAM-dependent methyltransferase [Pseudomonadota bacterium]
MVLEDLFGHDQITGKSGRVFDANVGISREEAYYLFDIVQNDAAITRTLEVGCALGFSSVAICSGLLDRPDAHHTIVDPRQSEGWESIGIENAKRTGFQAIELIEDGSEFVLPSLAKTNSNSFDFIFIDGWHTFDHTMLDVFYSIKLLRIGGILTIDDASWPAVAKALSYWEKVPCLNLTSVYDPKRNASRAGLARAMKSVAKTGLQKALPSSMSDKVTKSRFGSMVSFTKQSDDNRLWDWYQEF